MHGDAATTPIFTREVGHPVTQAIQAFGDGRLRESQSACCVRSATSRTASAAAMRSATCST